ncbi:hypothetical protein QBD00_003859 [Ochrobactrum sp. AN78]|nr:hypothetical protein [Ochrobactrum sp. AN78]
MPGFIAGAPMSYSQYHPFDSGLLAVSHSNEIYWEASGNPDGKPALYGLPLQKWRASVK